MADLLRDYLRSCAGRRFRYGEFDCGLFLAGWIRVARGIDPAAGLRGRYGALSELPGLERPGGFERMVARLARAAGLSRTRAPVRGDVAVIVVPGGPPVGAIRAAKGWLVVASGGGISRTPSARVLEAWAVGNG